MEDETLEVLNSIFQDVFEDDDIRVNAETTAKDVEGWDSLAHVRLMVSIERRLRIKFTSREVAGLKNVGELLQLIEQKQRRSSG